MCRVGCRLQCFKCIRLKIFLIILFFFLFSLVFGNCNGIAMVDYIQKTILLNLGTIELYGSNDPYQRQPKSPRKARQASGGKH